jgi:hypothetical protein
VPVSEDTTLVAAANLAVKFLLELAALALLAYWGAVVGSGVVAVVLAAAAPLLMVAVWGTFAAPRAAHRLPDTVRIPLELGSFAVACTAGFVAGATAASTVFAVLAVLNAVGLTAFRQWAE